MVATAGQVAQLIQSTLMIGRAQTKLPDLKVDRVLLAGGGASLKGLDAYLKQAMGVPVERFNPFEAWTCPACPTTRSRRSRRRRPEFASALGLAQMLSEPAAFRLEVLPDEVRRKRDFATKGVFAIAAAVVAAGGLGVLWSARRERGRRGRAPGRRLQERGGAEGEQAAQGHGGAGQGRAGGAQAPPARAALAARRPPLRRAGAARRRDEGPRRGLPRRDEPRRGGHAAVGAAAVPEGRQERRVPGAAVHAARAARP